MMKLSRRDVLKGSTAMALIAAAGSDRAFAASTVHDITMAAPDIICVELRDPSFTSGKLVELPADHAGRFGSWVNPGGEWGRIIGRDQNFVRTQDIPPSNFIDRKQIDDAAGYAPIGGRKILAVYRKSVPYDSGIYRGHEGETIQGSSFKHYLYLHLQGVLRKGPHVIRWPGGVVADTPFAFDDKTMRAISIRATQHGHAPGDEAKIAYLALWLPDGPEGGAVDFRRYNCKQFHVLDSAGQVVFTGPVSLRRGPGDPEPGCGFPGDLVVYPDMTAPKRKVTGASRQRIMTITAPAHGFVNGQGAWIDDLQGMTEANGAGGIVFNATRDTFELAGVDSSKFKPYTGGGYVLPGRRTNRSGTYVFELDYSAWRPRTAGNHRLYLTGIGVSDEFAIDRSAWLSAAKKSMEGLYHQRSGIRLDGRFGYSRPQCFRPGKDFQVLHSNLPFSWSTESDSGFLPFQKGASSPWITKSAAPSQYWGGYMDAGDWDRRVQHLDVSFLLLDVFELLRPEVRNATFGIPKSSELLDPSLYGGTDDLPDLIHEAIWNIDFYRRLQTEDGSIHGGIESADTPNGSGEPSYLEHNLVFVYAPDHVSTYRYVRTAAKLAGVLSRLNQQKLAELYRASAIAAWNAAESAYADPDKYYEKARTLGAAEFSAVPWEVRKKTIQQIARQFRVAAAGSLFRLTGSESYRHAFESLWGSGLDLYAQVADGAWEYANAVHPNANKNVQAQIRTLFLKKTMREIIRAQNGVTYPSAKYRGLQMFYGEGSAPAYNEAQLLIRAHKISGQSQYLKAMQMVSAHILGANQVGLSFTLGLGKRWVRHPLHEDHRAMGVAAPQGLTIYGWAPQRETSYGFVFGDYYTPLPEWGTKEFARNRRVEPFRFTMPVYEYLIEHPLVIMQQEYTVHQTIGTTAAIWMYLHGQATAP